MEALRLLAAGCAVLAACDADPARSVQIIARPAPSAEEAARPAPGAYAVAATWQPEACPPPESSQGEGTFVATGACAFAQTGPVSCIARGDDFFIDLTRPAGHGASLRMFGNVERYKGPGTYQGNSLLVSVRTADAVFPWNGGELKMTVGEGERFVVVEPASLLPGFMRGAGPMHVAGKLWCTAPSGRQ